MTLRRRSDVLFHYGVEGQKKGVRRYQNEDGTLTALGLRHNRILRKKLAGHTGGLTTAERIDWEEWAKRFAAGKGSVKYSEPPAAIKSKWDR